MKSKAPETTSSASRPTLAQGRKRLNHENSRNETIAVVLFQLGGPDSLEAVEPFLHNLFSDPGIIEFPFARIARSALARLISARRPKGVREHYAHIGGKSPIRELTSRQKCNHAEG